MTWLKNERTNQVNTFSEGRIREHPDLGVTASMPSAADMIDAEFIVASGGELAAFDSRDRLVGVARLAPVLPNYGKASGNLR